jgi:5'(3')-deoxyribonucleotidase
VSRYVIAVDVDGVLADFVGGLAAYGAELSPEDVTTWDLRKCLSHDQYRAADVVMHMPGFALLLKPYDGAAEFLATLRAIPGARVVALTAPLTRSLTWMGERMQWLTGMGFDPHDVVFCAGDLKGRFAADVLIEDRPDTVKATMCKRSYLVERPWTRNCGMPVYSLETIAKAVVELLHVPNEA